eukprot:TRINITY_DN2795_c0_g1_i1.p1 TRINITY_DN2795_c0_g1~~TRINITY_DN2795_c0_g1_i1.p1  ORF type:complete len:362 (-),score=59.83 TRINITY_DN2795_c0_g1_i1:19-1104(-)
MSILDTKLKELLDVKNHHVKTAHPSQVLYTNPWPSWSFPTRTDQLYLSYEFLTAPSLPSVAELDKHLPVDPINFEIINNPNPKVIQTTWIGHATFLVQYSSFNILTDPVWSERCSFSQWVGPKRFRRTPCSIRELPKIHLVILSHNHYDHLDYASIQELEEFHKPTYFVPLGKKVWFQTNFPTSKVEECDWWQSLEFSAGLTATFVPVQHWSGRALNDRFQSLWGGWALRFPQSVEANENQPTPEKKEVKVFFCGDTGYCPVFDQIGKVLGPFEVGLIPIGAYSPRWFMKFSHINPEEAVQIAIDIQAKQSIGMHWGTFMLTTEPVLEPRELLRKDLVDKGLPPEFFITINHGETLMTEPE